MKTESLGGGELKDFGETENEEGPKGISNETT